MDKTNKEDIQILRDLAKQYAEISANPTQEERRKLWSDHFSLKKTRPPILVSCGMSSLWCREVFSDKAMKCKDSFYRDYERMFRLRFFHDSIGDDCIFEPWITLDASVQGNGEANWGVDLGRHDSVASGARRYDPPIKDWSDVKKLKVIHHQVDEKDTKLRYSKLYDAIGDILTIDIIRCPVYFSFGADISTDLGKLRGIETFMLDMYENPKELHNLLAFMQDGILTNNQEAEDASHYTLTLHNNQAMPYVNELSWPKPNTPCKRKDLWGFVAAQEFTLVSPEFHDEFLFKYQIPIMEKYGLVHYGCCEDLTRKIDILRKLKNLRSIAVTPVANLNKCVEQIGSDYVVSWRPNPAEMVCVSWDKNRIKRIIGDAKESCKNSIYHIRLKDVHTVQGEPDRLARWVKIVRDIIEK
ncbi:MAG: hypothetical protein PHE88_10490 [Elusimicrobia bacterium]|nr:hypothetical protein [Elusimicrobiota bacterium]